MNNWVFLSLIYGLLCGTSDLLKKQALKHTSVLNTLISFNFIVLLVLVSYGRNYYLHLTSFCLIFLKTLCVFFAWTIGFKVIKQCPISIYSIIMLSKVIFSGVLSSVFLKEQISQNKIFGFLVIAIGILIANFNSKKHKKISAKNVMLTLLSASLIAVSLFLDKIILKTCSRFSLQFYFTLLLLIFLFIHAIITKQKISVKPNFQNSTIIGLGMVTFLADATHFLAAANAGSSVVGMTLLRHSSLIISVFLGSIVFKEKQILLKLVATVIVVLGLVISVT